MYQDKYEFARPKATECVTGEGEGTGLDPVRDAVSCVQIEWSVRYEVLGSSELLVAQQDIPYRTVTLDATFSEPLLFRTEYLTLSGPPITDESLPALPMEGASSNVSLALTFGEVSNVALLPRRAGQSKQERMTERRERKEKRERQRERE